MAGEGGKKNQKGCREMCFPHILVNNVIYMMIVEKEGRNGSVV